MRFTVRLNGTGINPYERLGLKRNPFPQIPRAGAAIAQLNDALATLGATPMPTEERLLEVLKELGASEEFVTACRENYRAGERTQFVCNLDDKEIPS